MNWWQSLILGIVQGLTEFLPVSSSAHLVLAQKAMGIENHDLSMDLVAHLGTLMAVFFVYRKILIDMTTQTWNSVLTRIWSPGAKVFMYVGIASIPTGIIGLAFKDFFEALFNDIVWVGVFLSITGIVLFVTRKLGSGTLSQMGLVGVSNEMSPKKALLIGFVQGAAIAPGISRSGSTIAAGLFLGLSRPSAPLFSFLLSIPAILGAFMLKAKDLVITPDTVLSIGIGFITSFLFGLVSLRLISKLVVQGKIDYFSYYLWILSIGILVYHFGIK